MRSLCVAERNRTAGTCLASLVATVEYGSGTPREHAHAHEDGDTDHEHAAGDADPSPRVPSHFITSVSVGFDLFRRANNRSRLSVQVDAENITNRSYLIAQESEFSPRQFSIPRLIGATARLRF
jgi:hypothetical protein